MKVKTRSRKVNRAWLQEHLDDPYVKRAQQDGYRSRAVYKLQEIDQTLGLARPGQTVVDLGAAPGAWSQYLRRRLALQPPASSPGASSERRSRLIALDVLPFEPIDGVHVIQGDFREEAVLHALEQAIAGRPVDLVVSDLAPNLSGIESADSARIADLVELAVAFAVRHLDSGGALVCKVFHGSGYSQLVELFKRHFKRVKAIKPKASRARSAETFLVGAGPRAQAPGPP